VFVILQGKLYKKSITGVLQRCITPQEGQDILKDIHVGVCGHHASSRAIAAKAFHAGFYWLTAIEDAKDIVRRCEACQQFVSRPHAPAAELQPIPLSWPFAQWGLDMVGKLHKSWPGGHVYMLVAVDKFTKWGRGSPSNNSRFYNSNQLHQVNSISLQSTTQHHHRQWNKLHIQGV
jgi:hypothetical protein